jgi:hypothetical protein
MAILTVNMPNLPKKEPVEVPPYGWFFNGARYEVDALDKDTTVGEPSDSKAKPLTEGTRRTKVFQHFGLIEPGPPVEEAEPSLLGDETVAPEIVPDPSVDHGADITEGGSDA